MNKINILQTMKIKVIQKGIPIYLNRGSDLIIHWKVMKRMFNWKMGTRWNPMIIMGLIKLFLNSLGNNLYLSNIKVAKKIDINNMPKLIHKAAIKIELYIIII